MSDLRPTPPGLFRRPGEGPVLCLAPHPDDEVIGCGGTLALHADRGDLVHVIVLFDGLLADTDHVHVPLDYVQRRVTESVDGGRELAGDGPGIEYDFWCRPEGHEPRPAQVDEAAIELAARLDEIRPRTIYTPWEGDGHLDHRVASLVLARALELWRGDTDGSDVEVWGYEVWTPLEPERVVDVDAVLPRKLRALARHQTQMTDGGLLHRVIGLAAYRSMHLGGAARHGEAFRVFRPGVLLDWLDAQRHTGADRPGARHRVLRDEDPFGEAAA